MLGVRKRVRRMVRAAERGGSAPGSRGASENYGGGGTDSQGGALALPGSQQRPGSFCSLRPPPPPGVSVSGPLLLGRGSGGGGSPPPSGGSSGGGPRQSDEVNGSHDAQNSSGDDTIGLPLSRLHSYSNMRPTFGGEATSASGPLGLRPPLVGTGALGGRPGSFSSRGKASELAVLAGLRQASLGRGGFGAVMAGDIKPLLQPNLPTMKEGSLGGATVSEFYSSQQSKQEATPPPPPHRQQNTDINLDQLSGEKPMRHFSPVGGGGLMNHEADESRGPS